MYLLYMYEIHDHTCMCLNVPQYKVTGLRCPYTTVRSHLGVAVKINVSTTIHELASTICTRIHGSQ